MARFIAITSRGLLEPLAQELESLDIRKPRVRPDCVEFDGSWADCFRVHRMSRIASRILLPVLDFVAYNEDDLYYGILRKHDFTKYIEPSQTLRIEAHTRDHKTLRDQRYIAMKVKDAVVDQFWAKFNERPNVGDDETADLRIVVRVVETKISVALDLTGETLSNRGYRKFVGDAPLRENVAAGMLRLSGWQMDRPLVDPFCGSGTILIEAALAMAGGSPLKKKRRFAFESLNQFKKSQTVLEDKPFTKRSPPPKAMLFGYDVNAGVLEKAQANARAAGVENWILFRQKDVRDLTSPSDQPGVILTNPPYGERMGTDAQVAALMADFSGTLKRQFKNWDAWILSGNREATTALHLKADRRVPLWNGPIDCRLLHYQLR